MIIKMKKLLLFMSEKEVDSDLTWLGRLGVLHITPFKPAKDESIDRIQTRIELMQKAIDILEALDIDPFPADIADALPDELHGEVTLMEEILETDEKRTQLTKHLQTLKDDEEWYKEWGKVPLLDIKLLAKNGFYIKLYLLNKKEMNTVASRSDIVVAGKKDDLFKVVLISEDPNQKLNFDEVPVPKYRLCTLNECIDEAKHDLETNKKQLKLFHRHIDLLRDALEERWRRFGVRTVQYSGNIIEDKVCYWKGYIPEKSIEKFTQLAKTQHWGYVIEDPMGDELDEVPTLIQSPKWVDRIRPVMNFMGLVPGYNELDVSKVFMIFFTFFSGILVGDAGYGLVFFIITLLVHKKQKFKPQIEFGLLYTLSSSIMLWGILTGTYFGVKEIAEIPIISHLVVGKIASFGGDEVFLQKFMFIIGAVHLSIGHLQAAWKYSNSVKAIAQVGWVAIIWGLYLFINEMVLMIPAPSFMPWLFVGGLSLVALFANPGKNILKGIAISLANLPLSVINGFSDIISYIRLYAVGLATVLMAVSFNEMAIGDGITTIVSGIVAIFILILGHGLNMILAAMAVIVHGVRLNMLEYAGHAGVEFSGSEYNPFKLKNETKINNA
jgi:V/A-type H+/Na+-transporting ATPase subunit I